jgi:hypothetical protein
MVFQGCECPAAKGAGRTAVPDEAPCQTFVRGAVRPHTGAADFGEVGNSGQPRPAAGRSYPSPSLPPNRERLPRTAAGPCFPPNEIPP